MALLVATFVTAARESMFDPAPGGGWADTEIVGYLNDAIRATCLVRPEAYTIATNVTLVAGTLQTLPSGGLALLDVRKNGSGKTVTQVDRALLEAADPDWGSATPVDVIEHYTIDPRDLTRYHVYPPATTSAGLSILYGALPATVAAGGTIALTDDYVPALLDYVLYRAFAKPSGRQDMPKALQHKQQWALAIGAEAQAQAAAAPHIREGTPT